MVTCELQLTSIDPGGECIMLTEIKETVGRVAELVGPSIVGIGRRGPQGSGVVVEPGRVLTNAHNIRAESVTVTFGDGRSETGEVLGADPDRDLAVVAVDTGESGAVPRGGAEVVLGSPVVALSNPGGRGLRVTVGYVSGTERSFRGPRGRLIRGSLEHTAPLLPGSSGGPVVDVEGRLVGINTNRLGEGFYLAIPAGEALDAAITELGSGEPQSRVRLGVGVAPNEVATKLRQAVGLAPSDGLLVRVVEEGSPADRAGLREGDLLVELDGNTLHTPDDLHDVLRSTRPDTAMTARILRGAEQLELDIQL
jgi:serine protease Do